MILTGKQPEEEQQPVESVKLETGTRLGTVKLTVDGKTTDNILIKGLNKKNILGNLNDKYAAKDHKHKEYLKPSEVNITGTGADSEVVFTEAVSPDTTNGTLTLKMKEGQQFERIIDLPFTGLKHLAFADKLTSYPDEMASSFYNGMCTDLNQDLEFVSTTRSSTINGGSLTIQASEGVGGNLICEDITADDITAGGDITGVGNVIGAGFVVPNIANASTKFLLANGGVDSYGRAWYMKRGVMYTGNVTGTRWMRAASLEMESAFSTSQYSEIILAVHDFTSQKQVGILALSYGREGSATSPREGYNYAKWIVKTADIDITRFVLAYDFTYTSTTATSKAYLYVKMTGAWQQFIFAKISEGEWSGVVDRWVLNTGNTTSAYNYTTIPETNQVVSTDNSYAATAGSIGGSDISVTGSISAGTTITATGGITAGAASTINGALTQKGVINITGSAGYSEGIRIHDVSGISSIWFRCVNAQGYDAGMWGITCNSSGMRFRGSATATGTTANDYLNIKYGGNVGISNTNPSYKLDVSGTVSATSYNTASDERLKAIKEEIKLNIEDIAAAPSILFNWKDKQDDSIHGGTIAQYWKDIASWAVNENSEGVLGLDYSVLALSSAIQCAREIVDLKKRIEKLEERL